MKIAWPIFIVLLSFTMISCGENDKDVSDAMSFEKNPSRINVPEEQRKIPSQGAPRPFEGQPPAPPQAQQQPQAPAPDLECDYEVIKKNFQSDPRYPEILEAVVAFEEYQDNMDVDVLTDIVTKFNNIYADTARFVKPCSEEYLGLFKGDRNVEEYATKMCDQMLLSQYFHSKFPCLRELTKEQQISLMTVQQ